MSHPRTSTTIDFAIIGAQKSASTAMQYYLHDHPSVYLPLGEQACFESPDFEQGRVARQIDFTMAQADKLRGLKRPTIFTDTVVIDRLRDHSPDCRLIMVCREPISRFVSHYFHMMNSSKLPVMEINRAVSEMFSSSYLSRYSPGTSLLRNGLYHNSLKHIREVHGGGSLFVTSQAAMKSDFETVMKNLCDFLELPFYPVKSLVERQKNVGFYDYRRAFWRKVPNALTYKYSLDRQRKEYRETRLIRNMGRAASWLFQTRPFRNPLQTQDVLTADSKALLRAYYAQDREKLIKDFPHVVYW